LDIITEKIIKDCLSSKNVEFKSTHHRLSLPIINRIYKKMKNGIKFDDIKVCEDLIIDGHHRYVSSLIAEFEIGKTNTYKTSATNQYDWNIVEFINTEWDTVDKIQYLNELDAEFNNISVEKIIAMTK
jgi:hypothetical protein